MKRLITCTDGTWNHPGIMDRGVRVRSNVELIFNCIREGKVGNDQQLKAYDSGVGSSTYDVKDQVEGGVSGAGIDKNIMDMYKFLLLNYEPGDHIYLFGFSRGAYTARSLAGFIRNCGLLKPEFMHLVPEAYELYRERNVYTSPDSDMMKGFRKKFCIEDITPIKFIGVWDTVGSLGWPLPYRKKYNHERYSFHDVKLSSFIENAYHALAIDERRKLFVPTIWEQSEKVKADPNHPQKMEQRWFPGAHCNIGGGYADSGLSDAALKWIIDKAAHTGLVFDEKELDKLDPPHRLKPNAEGELRNSRTLMYFFWLPVNRALLKGKNSNEKLDESVRQRYLSDKSYRPAGLNDIDEVKKWK
jgi:uncharacterized protein (DUF2235 family)